jgi:hypothetical protein
MTLQKMKLLISFLIPLTASWTYADQKVTFERIVRYQEKVAGHLISVVIHQRPYDFSNHRITGGEKDKGPAKIDGVEFGGTDGGSPIGRRGWPMLETIAQVDLEWDGKKIPVSPKLHLNLLNLPLCEGYIQFVPRPSGEELLIQANGGDGGAAYGVSLVLRRNGEHKQYLYSHGEDLPPAPYEFVERLGTDDEGRSIVNFLTWLEPGAEKASPEPPASRPESKTKGGDKPQPEAEGRSR